MPKQEGTDWNRHNGVGATLLQNWVEERASEDLVLHERSIGSKLNRTGHKNILGKKELAGMITTHRDSFTDKSNDRIVGVQGTMRRILEDLWKQEIMKEIEEDNARREASMNEQEAPISIHKQDFTHADLYPNLEFLGTTKPTPEQLAQHRVPVTFWLEHAKKYDSATICSLTGDEIKAALHAPNAVFARHAAFSTPVTEYLKDNQNSIEYHDDLYNICELIEAHCEAVEQHIQDIQTIHVFLPCFVEYLFGTSGATSMLHTQLSIRDSNNLKRLLSPKSKFIKLLLEYENGPTYDIKPGFISNGVRNAVEEREYSNLPITLQRKIHKSLNKMGFLMNQDFSKFTIEVSMLEYFLISFLRCATMGVQITVESESMFKKLRSSSSHTSRNAVIDSCYYEILQEYLDFFFPVDMSQNGKNLPKSTPLPHGKTKSSPQKEKVNIVSMMIPANASRYNMHAFGVCDFLSAIFAQVLLLSTSSFETQEFTEPTEAHLKCLSILNSHVCNATIKTTKSSVQDLPSELAKDQACNFILSQFLNAYKKSFFYFLYHATSKLSMFMKYREILSIWMQYITPWGRKPNQNVISTKWLPFIVQNYPIYNIIFRNLIQRAKHFHILDSIETHDPIFQSRTVVFRKTSDFHLIRDICEFFVSTPGLVDCLRKIESTLAVPQRHEKRYVSSPISHFHATPVRSRENSNTIHLHHETKIPDEPLFDLNELYDTLKMFSIEKEQYQYTFLFATNEDQVLLSVRKIIHTLYSSLKIIQNNIESYTVSQAQQDNTSTWKFWQSEMEYDREIEILDRLAKELKECIGVLEQLYAPYWGYLSASLNDVFYSPVLGQERFLPDQVVRKRLIPTKSIVKKIEPVIPLEWKNPHEIEFLVWGFLKISDFLDKKLESYRSRYRIVDSIPSFKWLRFFASIPNLCFTFALIVGFWLIWGFVCMISSSAQSVKTFQPQQARVATRRPPVVESWRTRPSRRNKNIPVVY